jgi:SAM-dependent methyltransferase
MSETFKYPGEELVLFEKTQQWKKYFSRVIKPYIKGQVLEVGAGIGTTTALLNDEMADQWLMLEPDEQMSEVLKRKLELRTLPGNCRVETGTIDRLTTTFDTIIYIDVLEHIGNDAAELNKAAALLNSGGHLIVLSPAFQFLYSPFDKAIGHYRRYNRKMLRKLTPGSLQICSIRYYDAAGFFASLMNRWFLKQKYPTPSQVRFWDKWLVPASVFSDKLFFHCFGKSIIAVWKKNK